MVPGMKTTALIYVRQSRTEKDKLNDSLSLAVQEEKCRALPAVAACDEVIVYRDANKSGRKARATFEAMTERIREGGVTAVAYFDQSRSFRNTALFIEFRTLMSEPDYIGIPVWAVEGGPLQRTPVGKFASTVLAAAHEMEAEMAGIKIKDAYRAMNAKGIATGAAAYGYNYVGETRTGGALQPDPERAPVVRRIFEMYANGTTPREIAQALFHEGIPANSRRGPAPENWKADTVTAMLSNITYIGKTYSVSRRDKTGDIIQASWPAIIEDGLFQRVKDRLTRLTPVKSHYKRASRADGKPARKQNPKTAHPFVFRGLLWCHECQRRFVGQHSNGHVRYFCGSRETTQPCSHAASIREEQFLPWVDDLMTGLEKGQLERLVQAEYGQRLRKPLIAKETAAGAIETIDGQLKRLDVKFDVGRITEEQYRAELADLRRKRAVYESQLGAQPSPKELEGLAERWRAGDERERHELLSTLFEKLHVHHGRIFGCTPRADRVNRVHLLLGTALDYVDGPGAALRNVERRGRDSNSRWASDP